MSRREIEKLTNDKSVYEKLLEILRNFQLGRINYDEAVEQIKNYDFPYKRKNENDHIFFVQTKQKILKPATTLEEAIEIVKAKLTEIKGELEKAQQQKEEAAKEPERIKSKSENQYGTCFFNSNKQRQYGITEKGRLFVNDMDYNARLGEKTISVSYKVDQYDKLTGYFDRESNQFTRLILEDEFEREEDYKWEEKEPERIESRLKEYELLGTIQSMREINELFSKVPMELLNGTNLGDYIEIGKIYTTDLERKLAEEKFLELMQNLSTLEQVLEQINRGELKPDTTLSCLNILGDLKPRLATISSEIVNATEMVKKALEDGEIEM